MSLAIFGSGMRAAGPGWTGAVERKQSPYFFRIMCVAFFPSIFLI